MDNKDKKIFIVILLIVTFSFSALNYLQDRKIKELENKIIELEKVVVKKDRVIESVAEQIGDELLGFYRQIVKDDKNEK